MRSLSKALYVVGAVAAVALTASAADARSPRITDYGNAYDAYVRGADPRASVPYDAGGPAYTFGQHGLDGSNDFQLQGR